MQLSDCKVGDRVLLNLREEGYTHAGDHIWATVLEAGIVGWTLDEPMTSPSMPTDRLKPNTRGCYVNRTRPVISRIEPCPQCQGYHP